MGGFLTQHIKFLSEAGVKLNAKRKKSDRRKILWEVSTKNAKSSRNQPGGGVGIIFFGANQ